MIRTSFDLSSLGYPILIQPKYCMNTDSVESTLTGGKLRRGLFGTQHYQMVNSGFRLEHGMQTGTGALKLPQLP